MSEPQSMVDQPRMPDLEAARSTHRLARYFRERKRVIRDRAITVAVTLSVLFVGHIAWRFFSERRLGRIVLTNQGPPLLVQVLPESAHEPIDDPVDLVTRSTLALPAGDYRLRVTGVGRLGRTYWFAVNTGETIEHRLSLDEGRLLGRDLEPGNWGNGDRPREEPMPFAPATTALELIPGRCDIVELTGKGIRRRDGVTGELMWDTVNPKTPYGPLRDPGRWLRRVSPNRWSLQVTEPAIDLNGDGTRDVLVVIGNNANGFLALSGQNGSMLWNYVAELDGAGGPRADGPSMPDHSKPTERTSGLIGWPAIGDIDGDGAADLIATLVFHEVPAEIQRRTGQPPTRTTNTHSRRIVQAINGRSGHSMWTFPLDRTFTAINGPYWDRPASLLCGKVMALVAIVDGSQAIVLDPRTGQPRSRPIDLGFDPVRPIQFADLDADGEPEILALGPGPFPDQQALSAFSIATGQGLWTATINEKYSLPYANPLHPGWPWLVDLDRDGRSEIVVPDSGPMPPASGFRGVQVLDGATGKTRWSHPMRPDTKAQDGLEFLLEAPDLNGDDFRELMVVSRFEGRNPPATRTDWRSEPERIYVDALSGRNGQLLWTWCVDLPESKFTTIWAPHFWGRGPDGWPLLAVPLGGQNPDQPGSNTMSSQLYPPTVHILEASTGRELDPAMGLIRASVADLDGDGLLDLWGEADGELRAFRGEPPELWRALGQFPPARKLEYAGVGNIQSGAADLDGDGIADTLSGWVSFTGESKTEPTGSRTAIARSGRDGHVLWKTMLDPPWLWFWPESARFYNLAAFPLPAGDLDGDGTPDIVVQKHINDEKAIGRHPATLPLSLLSGRDGRHLWSVGPLPLGFKAYGFSQVTWFEPVVIEPNAAPDLLVVHRSPFLKPSPFSTPASPWSAAQERLTRVSGRTGQILWDIPLEEQPKPQEPGTPRSPNVADFDGDGSLDAAIVVRQLAQAGQSEFELKLISLHDGATHWSRVLHYQGFVSGFPQVEVGKGAPNDPATLFAVEAPSTKTSNELLVHAIDGRDGTDRWAWRSGVGEGDHKVYGGIDPIALDGKCKDSLCVTYSDLRQECRIVILDSRGQERAHRVLPRAPVPATVFPPVADYMLDLDGDGRDELIVWNDNRLRAWGSDLKDRWSLPAEDWQILRFLPPSGGRSGTLLLPPARGVDASSGEVRWTYKPSPLRNRFAGDLLDPGDSTQTARLVSTRHDLPDTVCRHVLPATARGDYAPPAGAKPPAGRARGDPRWIRPLPWTTLMDPQTARTGLLAMVGLALLNVALPLGILRLAAWRRPWSLRALMALPVAAAVPLTAFPTLEPLIPIPPPTAPLPSSPIALFALGTLAGVPLVAYVALAGWSLIRRRFKTLALLAGFTALASLAIAATWLWADMRFMPTIEHYCPSGWYLVLIPGALVASLLMLIGLAIGSMHRWITWRATRTR
jgi:hypothetical protein